jgi:flagellar hook-associated protein 3 FlgL
VRVTSNMMMSNSLYNISNNMQRLDKAQQQESTQSKIQLPSDDPEVATQAVKYRNYVSTVGQYQKNVDDATSWMKVTEGALSDLHDVVQKIRDLTVTASTGSMNDSNLNDIKQEVAQLKKTGIQILNTSYAGRYVFAGYETDTEPYTEKSLTVGLDTVDRVTFKGKIVDLNGPVSTDVNSTTYADVYAANSGNVYQNNGVKQAMNYNIGFGNQITVNVEGQDVVGTDSGNNLFATLDKLLIGLDGKKSYQSISSGTATGSVTLSSAGCTVTAGINDKLALAVDGGVSKEFTIPPGAYASSAALVAAVNKGISSTSLSGMVSASLNSSNQLVFTSASTSNSSAVVVSDGTPGGALTAYVGTATTAAGGTAKTTAFTLTSILGDLDTDLDRISAVTSSLGARENTATIATNRLGDDNTVYTKLMATNESVDAAEVITKVAAAKVVYESSLAAAAKATSKSLLDYIS